MKHQNIWRDYTQRCLSQGFTLIELLVVVLIIGILAAVAVPQYQKAVEKARLNSAVATIANFQEAIDLWLLENGGFPNTVIQFAGRFDDANTSDLPIDVLSGLTCTTLTSSIACLDSNGYQYRANCQSRSCMIWATIYKGGRWWTLDAWKGKESDGWEKTYTDSTESSLSTSLLAGLESQGWRNAC